MEINFTADTIFGIIFHNIERLTDKVFINQEKINQCRNLFEAGELRNRNIILQSQILILENLRHEIKCELPYINEYINGE